jgi:hypothetical protein
VLLRIMMRALYSGLTYRQRMSVSEFVWVSWTQAVTYD